jgi:hypothetical protein
LPMSLGQPRSTRSPRLQISFASGVGGTPFEAARNRGSTDCRRSNGPSTTLLGTVASCARQWQRQSPEQDIQPARDSGTRREALDPMQRGHPSLPLRYIPFRSDRPHLTRIERLKAVRLNRNNL